MRCVYSLQRACDKRFGDVGLCGIGEIEPSFCVCFLCAKERRERFRVDCVRSRGRRAVDALMRAKM